MEGEKDLVCNSDESGRSEEGAGSKVEASTGRVIPVLVICLVVCTGGVIGGYSHGYPSPTLLDLQRQYEGGERVTAFSSSSVYAGIFGVRSCSPAPPTITFSPPQCRLLALWEACSVGPLLDQLLIALGVLLH